MATVHLIKEFHTAQEQDRDCGTVNIYLEEPRTPQVLDHFEGKDILSSPPNKYTITFTQSPMEARLRHKETDRARLKSAKGTILTFEDRIRALEDDMKIQNEARKAQENIIFEWETCDRLAQGLNDLIKDAVMNSDSDTEDFSEARVIWSAKNQYRYLPHLFTEWWLSYAKDESDPSNHLPSAFDQLPPSEISKYQSRRPLTSDISNAAERLWFSSLQNKIDLMLTYYHYRPKGRDEKQHPIPSTAFASAFVNAHPDLDMEQKILLQSVIDSGKKRDGVFLFGRSTVTGLSCLTPLALPAYAPPAAATRSAGPATPASHAMGTTRGVTRQRELGDDDDDDSDSKGAAMKKQKRS